MMTIREIKAEAIERLKYCWAESVMICLLELGSICLTYTVLLLTARITGVCTADNLMLIPERLSVSFIVSAAVILAVYYISTIPLHFGIRWFFWQCSAVCDVMPVSSVFACYASRETRLKCMRLKAAADLRRLGWGIAFAVPVAAEIALAKMIWQNSGQSGDLRIWLYAGCIVMTAGAVILYLIFTLKYIPVGYLMAANPYAGAGELLRLSKRASNRKNIFTLRMYGGYLRFLPLGILIFPILVLRPYVLMATAVSVRESLAEIKAADETGGADEADGADNKGKADNTHKAESHDVKGEKAYGRQ